MPKTSKRWHEADRTRMAPAFVTGALLASFCLIGPSGVSSVAAEDEKTASSADQPGQEQAQGQEKKEGAQSRRQAPVTKGGQVSRGATPPPKPGDAGVKSAPPPPVPPLRFTDFDLEKYHRPIPQDEDEEGEEAGETAAPGGAAAAGATEGGKTVQGLRARRVPKPASTEPGPDPLQPFKDREAKEKFRQMQIDTGRERIAKLQARLDYLNAKKNALENPAPVLSGQTQIQNPPKPGEPPPPPTPIQGPGRGLTATPGPGKMPVVGFFPPIPPPQTDEDKENDRKLKVKDLLKQVDEEIKTVQEDLETAKDELASVETRFAQESPSR